MNDITIVTAFFDIGRGNWTPDKGLPHYLQRTNDTYFERFANMAKLDNHMVVYTSADLADRVKEIREDKLTDIFTLDFSNSFKELREKVSAIQNNSSYLSKINPMQVRNPEYWNADYVVVNILKSSFVCQALPNIKTDLVAWMDFGYCREPIDITHWQYPFDKDKIHFFTIKDWIPGTYIQDIISNNDVHVTGPMIVAGKEKWPLLERLVHHNTNELLKNDLIDDDQTILLMSYLSAPNEFELHPVNLNNWFVAFKDFHNDTN